MRTRTALSLASLALVLVLTFGLLLPPVAAQDQPPDPDPSRDPTFQAPPGALLVPGDPPAVGEVILEDLLTAPGAVSAANCPSGRNVGEFVGEGIIFKVTGKCSDADTAAFLIRQLSPSLVVPDGEVRLEFKVVTGHSRALVDLLFRFNEPGGSYALGIAPGVGLAFLVKTTGPQASVLARRTDLAGRTAQDDWNSLAVRLRGQNLWALLNDEAILSASDPSFDRGGIGVGLNRIGDPNDNPESAVVFQNLRVSKLAPPP